MQKQEKHKRGSCTRPYTAGLRTGCAAPAAPCLPADCTDCADVGTGCAAPAAPCLPADCTDCADVGTGCAAPAAPSVQSADPCLFNARAVRTRGANGLCRIIRRIRAISGPWYVQCAGRAGAGEWAACAAVLWKKSGKRAGAGQWTRPTGRGCLSADCTDCADVRTGCAA
jgi:hypothetical protein